MVDMVAADGVAISAIMAVSCVEGRAPAGYIIAWRLDNSRGDYVYFG